jgi:FkbM family methyltransferase
MFFSQFGEDKFLIDNFLCKEGIPKFYIELGALDGVKYSNTKTLQDEYGWSGILIEPIPSAFEKLVLNRPGNVLVNSLVGTEGGQEEFRYFSNPDLQCVSAVKSTQRQFHQRQWMDESTAENDWLACQISTDLQTVNLPTRSLASIIQQSGISAFGLLSLDVEGHELEVLGSVLEQARALSRISGPSGASLGCRLDGACLGSLERAHDHVEARVRLSAMHGASARLPHHG